MNKQELLLKLKERYELENRRAKENENFVDTKIVKIAQNMKYDNDGNILRQLKNALPSLGEKHGERALLIEEIIIPLFEQLDESPAEITKLREESAELKERYEKLCKDWAKSRAEVFQETNAVFQKMCADCKDGTAAKSAQAAYEKQLKWREEAEAENERLQKENEKLSLKVGIIENIKEDMTRCRQREIALRTENKRLEKALELATSYANYVVNTSKELGAQAPYESDIKSDFFKRQAEADKKGE